MKKTIFVSLSILLFVCMIGTITLAQTKTGEEINWQVVSTGGTEGSDTYFILDGTVGQTASGEAVFTGLNLNSGFWQKFLGDPCCILPGDAGDDGLLNILDVTYLINYLYKSGPTPPCMPQADADGSGSINLLDITRIIGYLYKSGAPPVCGPDPWPY